jgi:hypothetical protein
MKKLSLALAGGVATLALLAGLAAAFPFAAIFLRVALESLMPQVIGWEARTPGPNATVPSAECICAPTKPP